MLCLNVTLHSFLLYKWLIQDYCRYPHDIHDRIWSPYNFEFEDWRIINTNFSISNPGIYDTPKLALSTAAIPSNASLPLEIYWTAKPPTAAVYLYLHFVEIQTLKANETREFDIYFNKNSNYSAFSPLKLEQRTITLPPVQCPGGECTLRLVRTKKSTLPPLINAMEAFSIIEFPFAGTNPSDGISPKLPLFLVDVESPLSYSNSYNIQFLCQLW